MGVDFSHCDACWGYFGFMRFRQKLVNALGVTEDLDKIYDNSGSIGLIDLREAPIFPLIHHSDCDGALSVKEMVRILPQLEAIVSQWLAGDNDKMMANKFIDGMKLAIKQNEPLEFT